MRDVALGCIDVSAVRLDARRVLIQQEDVLLRGREVGVVVYEGDGAGLSSDGESAGFQCVLEAAEALIAAPRCSARRCPSAHQTGVER